MIEVLTLAAPDAPEAARAVDVLEAGGLVILPDHPFALRVDEHAFFDAAVLADGSKNVSLAPTGGLGGTALEGEARARLEAMVARYANFAQALVEGLAPDYAPALQRRRTSFRPGPVDSRVLSPRKDDRRLHVDAFPANPVQGRRILRVFTNVNPDGEGRCWEVGEDDFSAVAGRMAPRARSASWAAWARERLGLTQGRRTAYDAAMLDLHDRLKLDEAFQATAARRAVEFPPGASWAVYTDSVLHAALRGRHAFEQTWLLPVEAMRSPERSPLRVLERQAGRALA